MPPSSQYFDLTKPRVVALIVFTALVGMFLAVPGLPPLRESVLGFLGIWLAASSAAAINQLLDSRIDAQDGAHVVAAHRRRPDHAEAGARVRADRWRRCRC